MESELIGASTDLASALGNNEPRSFAYTCCDDWVGLERTNFRPMVARLFPAARGGRERALVDPYDCDFSYVPAWIVPSSARADHVISFIDAAVEQQRWAVLCFHGVSDTDTSHFPRDAHRAVCKHVALRQDELWCDTFLNVATHLRRALNHPSKEH
jgi:hypothetical protein